MKDIPAFPTTLSPGHVVYGMTLRDYFAAKAMQALISVPGVDISHQEYAHFAYKAADAMLKERGE